jgi:hypothetical protein
MNQVKLIQELYFSFFFNRKTLGIGGGAPFKEKQIEGQNLVAKDEII